MKISLKIHERLKTFSPKWLSLSVTSSCLSLIFLNLSAMPVAIPSIAHQLYIPVDKIEWIVNVYFLMFALLILPAGRLVDIFGIQKLMSLGFSLFALGSFWGAASGNFEHFLAGRAIQGIGGALMFPAMGAHLISSFPTNERGRAIGLNTSIASFFWIIGPIIGGIITQYTSWRYLILFNIPLCCFGLVMTLVTIPKLPKKNPISFDVMGALLLILSVGSITIALMQGTKWGWNSNLTLSIIWVAVFTGLCFSILSYFRSEPIIDFDFFRRRSFTTGTLCACLTQMISMVMVFWALYMQNDLAYSPTVVGGLKCIAHIPVIFSSPLGGYIGDKWGVKLPVIIGFLLSASGLVLFMMFANTQNVWHFIPALVLFGIGQPLTLAPCYSMSMEGIPQGKCAAASGITLGLRQLSLPFGMAILSALYSSMLGMNKTVLFAFRSLNLLTIILAFLGFFIALTMFPKQKKVNS